MAHFSQPIVSNPFMAFDPSELRSKIIERLNESKIFTDQNYQGSNLSAIIDIIGYVFGTLQYYNSKTSSESMFSEAQIYENMNRIVKLLNYKPVGRLSQNVPFNLYASSNLSPGTYIIPRFSYISSGDTIFTVSSDIAFSKTINNIENIVDVNNNYLLHQGTIEEYPVYTAIGIENETLFLSLNDSIQIDHFNIFVYVKSGDFPWREYKRIEDRSTYTAVDEVCEIRFNANKKYEICFGDGINGVQLRPGDQVAVYYLNIDPLAIGIGPGSLNIGKLLPFNSLQFKSILSDTANAFGQYLAPTQFNSIQLTNTFPSSTYSPEETVESIRNNAPKIFRSQHRLVSLQDYDYFVKTNFNNLISTSHVVDNDSFLRGHMRYLNSIGLNNPQNETNVLFNQVQFANSCNFNNIYIYSVPTRNLLYMSSPQKEYVLNELEALKTATSRPVFMDPEYMYFDFYVKRSDGTYDIDDINLNKLKIFKNTGSRRSNAAILFDVIQVFRQAFDKNTLHLGQDINTHQLSTDILSIEGVKSIQTYRDQAESIINEISFIVWNSKYPKDDVKIYTQSVHLDYFQFAIFNNIENLTNRIEIVDTSNSIKIPEF